MLKDLNRFQKKHKENYKNFVKKLKNNSKEIKGVEYIFPIFHGSSINSDKDYRINNIIEAREFINNKVLGKNIIDICNELLKSNVNNINQILEKNEALKLKSSLTLFEYVTRAEISSLLQFRNYDKRLVKKNFTNKKEFSIFKKVLNQLFDGATDNETTLLIESEIFEFSNRNTTLKNISKEDLCDAEDLLMKYSELGPIVLASMDKSTAKKKVKEFLKGLTPKENRIFNNFNINNSVFGIKKNNDYEKVKYTTFIVLGTFLFTSIVVFATNKLFLKNDVPLGRTISNYALPKVDEKVIITKVEEAKKLAEEEAARIAAEEEARIQREEEERRQAALEALQKPVFYVEATGNGNQNMVNIAASQVGNKGGEPFWSWYGFNYRVDWCAIFISWVANQAGLLGDTIPKFSVVSQGISYYKQRGLYRGRDYTPRPGDLIFFDWNYNGIPDHVGLVKSIDASRVYTIEGNAKDECKELNYARNNPQIIGYGTPNY